MTSTRNVLPKKKGRPATGKDPVLTFRSSPELTARLVAFAADAGVPRSEAIRQILEEKLG